MPDVTLTTPQGTTVSVPEERAQDAIDAFGYTRESSTAELERQTETALEEHYGGQEASGFVEGVLSVGTGSGSDYILPLLPGFSKQGIRERKKRTTGRVVGEVVGDVALAVASGGTGALAKAAVRTPVGALSRATAKYIARGGKKKIGRAFLGGAAEGVQASASSVLSDIALSDEPIAGDAILSRLVVGGLTGGAVGGAVGIAGRAAKSRLAKRLANQADETGTAALERTGKDMAELAKVGSPGSKPLRYESFLTAPKRTRKAAGDALGEVLLTVDDAGARATAAAGDLRTMTGEGGLLSQLPEVEASALRSEIGVALNQHRAATNAAKRWTRKISKDVDLDAIRSGKASFPELQSDQAVEILANLDETTAALDQTLGRAQKQVQAVSVNPLQPVMLPEPPAPPPSRWQAWGERLADAGAAVETLQAAGVGGLPEIEDAPLIGPALGAFLKFRAASKFLGHKSRIFKSTPKAQAAATTVRLRDAIDSVAERVASGALKKVPLPRIAARIAGGMVRRAAVSAQQAVERQANPELIRSSAQAELVGVPAGLREAAVERAVASAQYMADRAPKPPFAGTAWVSKDWEPSLSEAIEWGEVVEAHEAPGDVLSALAAGAARPIAAGAVRDLYPDLWQAQRTALLERMDRIATVMGRPQRINMGQSFELPFDPSQMPSYGAAPPMPPQDQPGGGINSGPLPTKSVSSELAMTGDEKRAQR